MDKDRFILFSTLLNDAQKSISRIKNRKMDQYGLGSAHTLCMCLLATHPDGLTKTELARHCGVDKAQISRVVSDIREKNYVSIANPECNYRQRYTLTDEGMVVAEDMRQIILDINAFVSDSISKEQIENFYETLKIICGNLKKAEKQF